MFSLQNVKEIVSNNTLYREEADNFPSYSPFRALRHAYGDDQLPYIFVEMKDAVMSMWNIQKPVLASM